MSATRRLGASSAAIAVVLLASAGPAFAQATRTWVSGVGDDANPCSRTAPCKTWAGAISKTAAGGEIDALDPGGFGAVTITKAMTLDGGGGQVASVLVAGTNGIVIAAGASDHVILRNLRIDGLGPNLNAGLNGIRFLSGAGLRIEDLNIFGFAQSGVDDETTTSSSLVVSNTTMADNIARGILVAPGTGTTARVVLENDAVENNGCGLVISTLAAGSGPGTCGIGTGSPAGATTASVTAVDSSMSANTTDGVLAAGSASAFLGSDLVTANATGLDPQSGGQLIALCGDTVIGNLTADGLPTSTVATSCGSGSTTVGPSGPAGPAGTPGPAGAPGLAGAKGADGKIELVTCSKVKVRKRTRTRCTGRLVAGTVKFTVSGATVKVTLSRGATSYGTGTAVVGANGVEGLVSIAASLPAGRYSLNLFKRGRVFARRTIVIR